MKRVIATLLLLYMCVSPSLVSCIVNGRRPPHTDHSQQHELHIPDTQAQHTPNVPHTRLGVNGVGGIDRTEDNSIAYPRLPPFFMANVSIIAHLVDRVSLLSVSQYSFMHITIFLRNTTEKVLSSMATPNSTAL